MKSGREESIMADWKAGKIPLHVAENLMDKAENEERMREGRARMKPPNRSQDDE